MILMSWKKLSVSTFQWGGRHTMKTSPRLKWTVLGTTNMEDFASRKTKQRLMIIPFERLDVNVISREDQLARASKHANHSLEQIIPLNRVRICLKILYSNFLFIHHEAEVGIWFYTVKTAIQAKIWVAKCLKCGAFCSAIQSNSQPASQPVRLERWICS